jgi:hypothetical protein
VHHVVAIAENWRQMLASQRANSLNIGESHWPNLEINPFMLKRVPDAPRKRTGASAFVSDPFEEDQRHGGSGNCCCNQRFRVYLWRCSV